jgi:MFS family permease
VSYATLLITGARLGDLLGRRRMFLTGVACFTLASLACGLAPGIGVLIAARFVQGAGAAAMVPQIMSVIQVRFTGAARARALGAYAAVLSSGFTAGQVIGGALVSANLFGSQWRPVFLVNVPIGLAVLALVPRVMPADLPARGRRLDLPGLAVAVPATCLITISLMLGHQENWPGWLFGCLALGAGLSAVFVFTERRVAARGGDPLLSLAVFRAPGLLPGLGATAAIMAGYGGFLFTLALFLQGGRDDSALRAGLTFAPSGIAFGLCGYFWRRLPERGHHLLTAVGCAAGALAYLALALDLRSGGSGGLLVQLWLVIVGGGLAIGFSSVVAHALVRVPLSQAADASGLLTTTIQLSQALGVAVFGSVYLSLDASVGPGLTAHAAGHALAVALSLAAAVTALGVAAGVPVARTVLATRRTQPPAGQDPGARQGQ